MVKTTSCSEKSYARSAEEDRQHIVNGLHSDAAEIGCSDGCHSSGPKGMGSRHRKSTVASDEDRDDDEENVGCSTFSCVRKIGEGESYRL